MERTRSPGSCGSQALKTKRMSKREQMNRSATSSIKESTIAGQLHPTGYTLQISSKVRFAIFHPPETSKATEHFS